MKYTTIFFDIDYCLMDTPTSEHRMIRELYALHGQTVGEEVPQTYRAINAELWTHFIAGEMTRARLYVQRFEELFKVYPLEVAPEVASEWFLAQWATATDPMPGAAHLLKRLQDSGVRVFSASNGVGATMNGRVAGAGLDVYLSGKFAADEIGATKPSPLYFDYILRHSGETDKKRALFVGDNPASDVTGALSYGMDACLFGWRYKDPCDATYAVPTMQALEDILFDEQA